MARKKVIQSPNSFITTRIILQSVGCHFFSVKSLRFLLEYYSGIKFITSFKSKIIKHSKAVAEILKLINWIEMILGIDETFRRNKLNTIKLYPFIK